MKSIIAGALMSLFLLGCGGSSDGSTSYNDSLTSVSKITLETNTLSLNVKGVSREEKELRFEIKNTNNKNIFFSISDDKKSNEDSLILLSAANTLTGFHKTSSQEGVGSTYIIPKLGYLLGEGSHRSNIFLNACYDLQCKQHISGSPAKVNLQINVLLDEELHHTKLTKIQTKPFYFDSFSTTQDRKIAGAAKIIAPSLDGLHLIANTNLAEFKSVRAYKSYGSNEIDLIYEIASVSQNVLPSQKSGITTIHACYDAECKYPIKGSPLHIDTNYEVKFTDEVQVKNSTFNILSDTTKTDQTFKLTGIAAIKGLYSDELHYKTEINHEFINDVYFNKENNLLSITAITSLHREPQVGLHKGTINIDICYDSSCHAPIKGSPISVKVNYGIDVNLAIPNNYEKLPIEILLDLDHNILEAKYIKPEDLLVISSKFPENAIYVYDLKNNKQQKFSLTRPAQALAIDNIKLHNRIAVGHDALVTIIDYNKLSPAFSQTKTIASTKNIFSLALYGDELWVTPANEHWDTIEHINIDTSKATHSPRSTVSRNSLIKLSPSGEYLYTLQTPFNNDNLEKFALSSYERPLKLYESQRSSLCGNFWHSLNGKYIYTACGLVLNSTKDKELDLKYAGKLPTRLKPSTSHNLETYHYKHLEPSNDDDHVVVIDEEASATLRFIDIETLEETKRYILDNQVIDGIERKSYPIYAFYDQDDHLMVIEKTNQYEKDKTHYRVLRKTQ